MTVSEKPNEEKRETGTAPTAHQKTEDVPKLPGVLFLLRDAFLTTWHLRVGVYGYAAWLLIPPIIYLFAQGVPSPYGDWLLSLGDVLNILLGLWVHAAILLFAALVSVKDADEQVNYTALSRRAWERVLPLFIVQILASCFIVFGGIALIIPGIIAWVWTAVASPVAILSDRTAWESLKYSYELTKGRFFPVLERLFVSEVFFTLLGLGVFSLYLVAGVHGSVASVKDVLADWPSWLEVGLSLIVIALYPIIFIFQLLLYFSLKKSYSEDEKLELKV